MTDRQLRGIVEQAFLGGHAAGVVDSDDYHNCDVPIGDVTGRWAKEIDDLVYEAKRALGLK